MNDALLPTSSAVPSAAAPARGGNRRLSRLFWLAPLSLVLALGLGPTAVPAQATPAITGSLPAISSISAGGYLTCAVMATAAKCWGSNYYGQLGNGTRTSSTVPIGVSGLSSGVVAISAGADHSCAVTTGGAAKCWGLNRYGQLGNGTTTDSTVPVDVTGLSSGVVAISAGGLHSCALTSTGAVKCWGYNYFGQLGNGTTTDSTVPVDVSGLSSGALSVNSSSYLNCAVTSAGAAKCWGRNEYGELGNGTTVSSPVPVAVSGLSSGVVAITGEDLHTCALTSTGAVKCWGNNGFGQLGDGTTTDSAVPIDVSGLSSGVASISAGGLHTCAVTSAGSAKCWGMNAWGELGDGTTTTRTVPVAVLGLPQDVVVDAGEYHTCAVTSAGAGRCWGFNPHGELGDGTATDRLTPVALVDVPAFDSIAVALPAQVSAGSSFTVKATATDALHNPLTSYNGPATWADSSKALTPSDPAAFTNGVSSTEATIATPARNDRLTITSGGVSGKSAAFNVLGPFAAIAVNIGTPVSANIPFPVTATATDTAGNTITDYNAAATWSNLRGGLTPAMPADFHSGVSITQATVPTVFSDDRITITSGGVSGQSGLLIAGGLASISFRLPGRVYAGVPFTLKALARDGGGAVLAGYNRAATWSDTAGKLSPSGPMNFVNGVSTTQATIVAPVHHDQITLVTAGVSGKTSFFNALGPFAAIAFHFPTPVTPGSPFTLRATATDLAGNVLTSYNSPATWSDLSGSLSPVAPVAFTNGVSSTVATISTPFANDRVTMTSGGVSSQSAFFRVL